MLMIIAALALAHPRPLAPSDSEKLVARAREAEYQYLRTWRQEWFNWQIVRNSQIRASELARERDTPMPNYRRPGAPTCTARAFQQVIRFDIDQHQWLAHMMRVPARPESLSFCPRWALPYDGEPSDEARGIDYAFPLATRLKVRALRAPVTALFDSAAYLLPGDAWITGQRVRLYVDQEDYSAALISASGQCRTSRWWCAALRVYVRASVQDADAATAALDTMLATMPPATRCDWSSTAPLLPYTARVAYLALSCARQDSANARLWWLADPLYLEPGNERRIAHYYRRVLSELHAGNDVDERHDWRDDYEGPALRDMVTRYGWPTTERWSGLRVPPGPARFDTHALYLGVRHPQLQYWGPQVHTIPSWTAITDPVHAQPGDWELGPERESADLWDMSWWATEFYRRYNGPLLDLSTQIGFLRRRASAYIAADAMWDSTRSFISPPQHAILGAITSASPTDPLHITTDTVDGRTPRGIFAPVASGPLLLGVEMTANPDTGAAARIRFGIAPPAPLSALAPGALALSDPILVRADSAADAPRGVPEMLTKMLGTTQLDRPTRLGVFWEVYGQGDHDTVDVALRIVRKNDASGLQRAGALVGLAHAGEDSLAIHWSEPRQGDPVGTVDGGVSIRPRGIVLDVSALSNGDYTVGITVTRTDRATATSVRAFSVVGR